MTSSACAADKKPRVDLTKACNAHDCYPEWVAGDWSKVGFFVHNKETSIKTAYVQMQCGDLYHSLSIIFGKSIQKLTGFFPLKLLNCLRYMNSVSMLGVGKSELLLSHPLFCCKNDTSLYLTLQCEDNKLCGHVLHTTRTVRCMLRKANGQLGELRPLACVQLEKPPIKVQCRQDVLCPRWKVMYEECSSVCGNGKENQKYSFVCLVKIMLFILFLIYSKCNIHFLAALLLLTIPQL